jgi:uncharacterized protein YndB with AHSA1/START domain
MSVEPVRKQVVVEASQARCFEVFTQGIDRWWPRQHHIGKSPLKRAVLESRAEGRWYAICEDGSECDTGRVLVWDPPKRLVLAWQITAEWQFDREFVTEVEVNFIAEGPRRTVVKMEHRDLERYGQAAAALRKELDSDGGWMVTLRQFAAAVVEAEAGAARTG